MENGIDDVRYLFLLKQLEDKCDECRKSDCIDETLFINLIDWVCNNEYLVKHLIKELISIHHKNGYLNMEILSEVNFNLFRIGIEEDLDFEYLCKDDDFEDDEEFDEIIDDLYSTLNFYILSSTLMMIHLSEDEIKSILMFNRNFFKETQH